MADITTEQTIYQPLQPDMLARLDPEFVSVFNATVAYTPPVHLIPWDPAIRNASVSGGSKPVDVGEIKDIPLGKFSVRVFTPEGTAPDLGWPMLLYFYGGGWMLGNIHSQNNICTRMCQGAKCVVVSVAYRLAPENPYPAAVEDAVEALHWVYENGKAQLNVDVTKFAVGGASSGANLAAVTAHKAALSDPPIPLSFQLLMIPILDQTSSKYKSWEENANTPVLNPEMMTWLRNNYLPNEKDRYNWDASPLLAPAEAFKKAPKTWLGICELDILRDEAIAYGEKLKAAGVDVETKVYKRAPHMTPAMDGVTEIGKLFINDAVEALTNAIAAL